MAKKPAKSNGNAPAPKKSKLKLIILILVGVIVLGAAGGGAWWFLKGRSADNHEKKHVVKAAPPVFMVLETFTVNLATEEEEHYLQTNITLQIKNKEDIDKMNLYMPQIRNRLLILLSSKKASEIAGIEGKKRLARDVMAAVNDPLYAGAERQSATQVLFTSFIIQ